jgi:hypothetical protein
VSRKNNQEAGMAGRKLTLAIFTLTLALSTVLTGAESQAAGLGVGLRAGFGLDPDQFVVGVQTTIPNVLKPFTFTPSFDVGFGDNVTTYCLNADVRFLDLNFPGSSSGFYLAAGPTVAHWKPEHGDSDTEIGISVVGGMRLPLRGSSRYNIEGRIGFSDIPDVRVLIGFFI